VSIRFEALIFDLDGTLVDTERFHRRSWEIVTARMGLSMPTDDYETVISGRAGREVCQELFGMSAEAAEEAVRTIAAEYWRLVHGNVSPLPGLREFLAKHAGVPRAVATSAIRPSAERMLAELELTDEFPVVVTISDIARGKPDPEIYLTAAAWLGVSPGRCLVFEDAPAGLQAASAAGMTAIGLTTTHADLPIAVFSIADYRDSRLGSLRWIPREGGSLNPNGAY
jgi:HAD superfamily hydrolase (TIGR01509 family)